MAFLKIEARPLDEPDSYDTVLLNIEKIEYIAPFVSKDKKNKFDYSFVRMINADSFICKKSVSEIEECLHVVFGNVYNRVG